MTITFVLWHGHIGGAERLTLALAGELSARGVNTHIVFVNEAGHLNVHLAREGLLATSLGLPRGSLVLRHPRTLAKTVAGVGTDVAIVGSFGYLGAALRAGGFRGAIIGVEHGTLHQIRHLPATKRLIRLMDRASGLYAHDAEVAVSRFMEKLARRTVHARKLVCIQHGVAVPRVPLGLPHSGDDDLRLMYAGRLISGKGVDVLLRALARLRRSSEDLRPRLTIAGDGPLRHDLESLTNQLRLAEQVTFVGWTDAVIDYLSATHVSVAPAYELAESFGMVTLEAMACGRTSIVSDRGALPELVVQGETGIIVKAGDPDHMASAIRSYALDRYLLARHGMAAHQRAREHFTLGRCADSYAALAESL